MAKVDLIKLKSEVQLPNLVTDSKRKVSGYYLDDIRKAFGKELFKDFYERMSDVEEKQGFIYAGRNVVFAMFVKRYLAGEQLCQ